MLRFIQKMTLFDLICSTNSTICHQTAMLWEDRDGLHWKSNKSEDSFLLASWIWNKLKFHYDKYTFISGSSQSIKNFNTFNRKEVLNSFVYNRGGWDYYYILESEWVIPSDTKIAIDLRHFSKEFERVNQDLFSNSQIYMVKFSDFELSERSKHILLFLWVNLLHQ
jgi:hypothetical protein